MLWPSLIQRPESLSGWGGFPLSFFFPSPLCFPSLPMPWIKQLPRLKSNFRLVYPTSNRLIGVSLDLLVEALLALATLYTRVFELACFSPGTLPVDLLACQRQQSISGNCTICFFEILSSFLEKGGLHQHLINIGKLSC